MKLTDKNRIILPGLLLGSVIIFTLIFFPLSIAKVLVSFGVTEQVVSKLYNKNPEVLLFLGSRHLGWGGPYSLPLAEKYLKKSTDLDPSLKLAHYQLARVYFLTTRYALALEQVNMEIENNPSFSRSYYLRGLIYGYDRKLVQSAADFREFISREPDEWAGYNDLAWILFQMGEYEETKKTIETALSFSRNPWLLNAYGVALLNLDQYEHAMSAFQEAEELSLLLTPSDWGEAYIGNDPGIYAKGLEEMRQNIQQNIERVNNKLSKN